jgi:glycosyltransferase involved in cell wall biosynthesis
MTKPRVSVVIPTYNGSKYIRESLASLQRQTLENWEAIVVDDGSTDSTVSMVREFMAGEPRMSLVEHGRNQQLPTALNSGFALARGDYLTWTSDDNLFRPRALDVMSRFLEDHPDVGLVYAAATIIDDQGREIRHRPAADPHGLYERNPVGWCFMYPAHVRHEIGDYDPACFMAEDGDYWFRISLRYRLATISEDLYLYRAHPGSLTGTRRPECERVWARVQLRYVPKLPWASRNEKSRVLYELMSFFKADHQLALSCLAFMRGVMRDPRYFLQRFRQKM